MKIKSGPSVTIGRSVGGGSRRLFSLGEPELRAASAESCYM